MILDKNMFFNKVRALGIMTEEEFLDFVHEVECTDRHYQILEDISCPIYHLITAGIRPKTAVRIIDGFLEKKRVSGYHDVTVAVATKIFLANYKPQTIRFKTRTLSRRA